MARLVIKKLCLLGDGAVGKSSLIRRYVFDEFEEDYTPTIGTKIMKKKVMVPEHDVEVMFMIWDIMGHKSVNSVPPEYFQGTEGVLLVADITRKETLENTEYWLKAPFKDGSSIPKLLVVNKVDLIDQAQFTKDEGEEFALKMDMPVSYTSARTGDSVETVFQVLAKMIAERM